MKTITLKQTGYMIKGIADLTTRNGGNACIKMKKFDVDILDEKTLPFILSTLKVVGVKHINGAIFDIYENYEGYLVFVDTEVIGEVTHETFINKN